MKKTQVGASLLNIRKTPYVGSMVETMEVLHRDHLGSVDAVTDANAPVIILAFEPFGARRSTAIGSVQNVSTTEMTGILGRSSALNSQGFTGHENLDHTGLIHMNGRVYDPKLSRFLSPDPIVNNPTNSQSWNRYSYVSNNPLKYTDPTGFCGEHISNDECTEEFITTGYKKSQSPPPCENCVDKSFLDNLGGGFTDSFTPPTSNSPLGPVGALQGVPTGGAGSSGGCKTTSSITCAMALAAEIKRVDALEGDGIEPVGIDLVVPEFKLMAIGIVGIKKVGEKAAEKTAKDIARRIERDLGKDARREFHDAKTPGAGDRTIDELKDHAQDLYKAAGMEIPSWLK